MKRFTSVSAFLCFGLMLALASTDNATVVYKSLPAPLVKNASYIAAKSFVANWSAVENASAYTVLVYSGTAFVDSLVVAAQNITSARFDNLIPELTYTYKVSAKGDGVNYANSALSAASPTFCLPAAAIPNNKLKVILKLDDLGVKNSVLQCAPALDFMLANNIKFGLGAIAARFDDSAPKVLAPYINAVNEKGEKLMEIWHHGFDHSRDKPVGTVEFKNRPYDDQKASFENADKIIKNLLGIQMNTFGTPFNQSDAVTNTVISENANYKVFLFSSVKPTDNNGLMFLSNRVNFENGTGIPEFSFFMKNYIKSKDRFSDYIILQGHPNHYKIGSDRLEQFKLILKFLMSEGVEFVTPYEYYESTLAPTDVFNDAKNADCTRVFYISSSSSK